MLDWFVEHYEYTGFPYECHKAWLQHLMPCEYERAEEMAKEDFVYNGKTYESITAFRNQLRHFTITLPSPDPGCLLLFEKGKGDPTVVYVDSNCIRQDIPQMKLSQYLTKALVHCGLIWRVDFRFRPPPRGMFPVPIAQQSTAEENLEKVMKYLNKHYAG